MADGTYTQKCCECGEEFDSLLKPAIFCLQCRLQEPEEDLEEDKKDLLQDPVIQGIYGDFIHHNPC